MPLIYNPELQGWECTEPTQEEQKALIDIAMNIIVDGLGEVVAKKIVQEYFGANLEQIPTEQMGNA